MKKQKVLKNIVFSIGLAVITLTANNLSAQDRGLFGRGEKSVSNNNGLMNRGSITGGDGITNGDFGEPEAPLGSGIAILIGAGLGYVALKKKEDK